MYSDEAGLSTLDNDCLFPDVNLQEPFFTADSIFNDILTEDNSNQNVLIPFDQIDSTKKHTEFDPMKLPVPDFTTEAKDLPVLRAFSTPNINFTLPKTTLTDVHIKPSKTLHQIYHSTVSDFEKLPEGKKRHISAPYDDEFVKLCTDENLQINTKQDGFIPRKFWDKNPIQSFGWCLANFFQKKNNANARFLYKLHNALILDTLYPELSPYIGVSWLSKSIIRVNKHIFGRFIGVKTVDNSLFHQQGNFPSHGFVEITSSEVQKVCPDVNLEGVDFDNVRLLTHTQGIFVQGCTEAQITSFMNRK